MKKINLVLTGYSELVEADKHNLFLGHWCNDTIKEKDINFSTQDYHWSDLSKVKNDYIYLKNIYELFLSTLTLYLNDLHKENRSENYWRVIIGPWLLQSTCIIFDRWETLKKSFRDNQNKFDEVNIIKFDEEHLISNDFYNFTEKMESHSWNHKLFIEIIKELKPNIKFKEKTFNKGQNQSSRKNNRINLRIIDKLLSIFPSDQKKLFYQANFKIFDSVVLYLKNGIMCRDFNEFNFKANNKNFIERKKLNLNFDFKNDFEKFLSKFILRIMPSSYLENYKLLLDNSLQLKFNPDVILTAFAHFNNDFFKIWIAQKILENKRFYICSHGGWVEKEINFGSWEKSALKFISWKKEEGKNFIQMPPNFFLKKRKILDKLDGKSLLFLSYHVESYAHRIQDGPISSDILNNHDQWLQFFKTLNTKIKEKIIFRQGPFNDNWGFKHKFINNFGEKYISKKKKLEHDFSNSKIIINTAMQTTFFETMKVGLPTIILLKNDLWNLSKDLIVFYNKLKSNNVIFTNYVDAVKHLNTIWENPLVWWNSEELLKLRNEFFKICCLESQNNLNSWLEFTKKI